jgi:hypothetical protein
LIVILTECPHLLSAPEQDPEKSYNRLERSSGGLVLANLASNQEENPGKTKTKTEIPKRESRER